MPVAILFPFSSTQSIVLAWDQASVWSLSTWRVSIVVEWGLPMVNSIDLEVPAMGIDQVRSRILETHRSGRDRHQEDQACLVVVGERKDWKGVKIEKLSSIEASKYLGIRLWSITRCSVKMKSLTVGRTKTWSTCSKPSMSPHRRQIRNRFVNRSYPCDPKNSITVLTCYITLTPWFNPFFCWQLIIHSP